MAFETTKLPNSGGPEKEAALRFVTENGLLF